MKFCYINNSEVALLLEKCIQQDRPLLTTMVWSLALKIYLKGQK
jgi:hypothetical protein